MLKIIPQLRSFATKQSSFRPSFAFALTRSMATVQRPRDPNTLSNYTAWASRHVTANFEIVFDQKKLVGNVVHQLESKTDGQTREVVFDSSFLDISQIKVNGQLSKWELLPRFEPFGSALKIQLESAAKLGENLEVDVSKLVREREALLIRQDLASNNRQMHCPSMVDTSANFKQKVPIYVYVFSFFFFSVFAVKSSLNLVSQCQAIHARSVFPCQDTPDIKSTFEFNIKSPHPVIASGLPLREKGTPEDNIYKFKQNVPIPSYLFALASGYVSDLGSGLCQVENEQC